MIESATTSVLLRPGDRARTTDLGLARHRGRLRLTVTVCAREGAGAARPLRPVDAGRPAIVAASTGASRWVAGDLRRRLASGGVSYGKFPAVAAWRFHAPVSIHAGAWRYPGAFAGCQFQFRAFAVVSPRRWSGARFDAFFMADHLAVLNMPLEALQAQPYRDIVRAIHAAVGPGRGHRAHRAGRHRLDHFRCALSYRPQVRLARPHQRRPRRLEHRHHLQSRRGA